MAGLAEWPVLAQLDADPDSDIPLLSPLDAAADIPVPRVDSLAYELGEPLDRS